MRGCGLGLCGPGWSPVIGFVNIMLHVHFHKMESIKDSPVCSFLFDIIFSSSILNTV